MLLASMAAPLRTLRPCALRALTAAAAALPLRLPAPHRLACRWHTAAPAPPAPATADKSTLPEARFHALADATLEALELRVTALEDAVPGLDLTLAMGVLTLRLGAKGTYVLNKQAPNRQIWWSSPVSGPRRYGWDAHGGAWVSTRDGHGMLPALQAELARLLGAEVDLKGVPGSGSGGGRGP